MNRPYGVRSDEFGVFDCGFRNADCGIEARTRDTGTLFSEQTDS
jgi:hypothetical protein